MIIFKITLLGDSFQQIIISKIPQNPLAENFPETLTLADIPGDMMVGDLIGIKVGDLSGNANPMNMTTGGGNTLATADFLENRNNEQLVFKTQDQTFEAGEKVEAEIIVEDIVSLMSWQGTFEFNPAILELENIEKNEVQNSIPIFNENRIEIGTITALWTNKLETLFAPKTSFFKLEFVAKEAGRLSDVLKITSNKTTSIAYNDLEERMSIELHFEEATSNKNIGYQLFQNYPNPVVDETKIEFTIPKNEFIRFEFINSKGEIIHMCGKRI